MFHIKEASLLETEAHVLQLGLTRSILGQKSLSIFPVDAVF